MTRVGEGESDPSDGVMDLDDLVVHSLSQLPRLRELSADELCELAGDLRMLSNVAVGWAARLWMRDTGHRA